MTDIEKASVATAMGVRERVPIATHGTLDCR